VSSLGRCAVVQRAIPAANGEVKPYRLFEQTDVARRLVSEQDALHGRQISIQMRARLDFGEPSLEPKIGRLVGVAERGISVPTDPVDVLGFNQAGANGT